MNSCFSEEPSNDFSNVYPSDNFSLSQSKKDSVFFFPSNSCRDKSMKNKCSTLKETEVASLNLILIAFKK